MLQLGFQVIHHCWTQRFFEGPHIVAFSDASHAPLKQTGRRGISGGVLTFQGCTLKTLSRHQALVSLSSMESELYALQSVSQEMVSMGKDAWENSVFLQGD